jgi:hypothetical protein
MEIGTQVLSVFICDDLRLTIALFTSASIGG